MGYFLKGFLTLFKYRWVWYIIIALILFLLWKFKIKIKWKSFLKRGFRVKRGDFGLYVYTGKQGTGKTYSLVEYLLDHKNSCVYFGNIAGIKGVDYTLINGFDGLIKIKNDLDDGILVIPKGKKLVIFYDEIFTELTKKSSLSLDIMDFLCQMRKRKIICLTTAQEWAELPITYRRFCRYEIDTHMYNLGLFSILWKQFKDAENMKWSDQDQEFIAPLVSNTITKTRKLVANSYDTFLRISSSARGLISDSR